MLSYNGALETISPDLFHTAFPIQPPPLRGTSFHRKEGVSTRAPSLGRGCRAQRGGVGFLFCGALVLSQTAYLRRSSSLSFMPLEPYPARFARHLPHAGKALSVDIVFSTYAYIRSDDMGIAVLSYNGALETISPDLFHTAFPIQPPPLRGTSFHRKEGVSTQAPSLGRGCRAQRGGVGFLFLAAKPPPLCLPHWGRGTAPAVDRVLSQTAYLRRSLPALFHTARTLSGSLRSPPSPRGEGFVSGIAVFPYRSLVFSSLRAKMYPHSLSISPRNPRA